MVRNIVLKRHLKRDENVISDHISDKSPPQRKILNMVFPILMHYCASRLDVTCVFAVYCLMNTSIEKEISEINLDIDPVFGLFFSLSMIFYIG